MKKEFVLKRVLVGIIMVILLLATLSAGWVLTIDRDYCCGCETCVDICPVQMLELHEGAVRIIPGMEDDCLGCEECVDACPYYGAVLELEEQ